MWFNTGNVEGRYVNRYLSVGPEGNSTSGAVTGAVTTVTNCGDQPFAVVSVPYIGTTGEPTKNWLYQLSPGGKPRVRGEWDYRADFKPASRVSTCSPDGQQMLALYASDDSRADYTGGAALTLVRINTADGTRSETELDMHGLGEDVRRGTMTTVAGRLYWINYDGDVLSVPLAGAPEVKREWTIPIGDGGTVATVIDTNLTLVEYGGIPRYSQYDLQTGKRTQGTIELPWLAPLIGAETESGRNTYAIADIATFPTR